MEWVIGIVIALAALTTAYAQGHKRGYKTGAAIERLNWERQERKGMRVVKDGSWPGYCTLTPRCILDSGHVGRCVEGD